MARMTRQPSIPPASPHLEHARQRLLTLLTKHSYQRKQVKLASGRESNFFIDCKQTVLMAEGHALVGELMFDTVKTFEPVPTAVGGVELGGCPLASAVALTSFLHKAPIDAVYVRKAVKDHGSARLVEGNSHLAPQTSIVVLEDVITTGGSTLKAIDTLKAESFDVVGVVCLVDREEGGRENLEAAGINVKSVFRRSDFLMD